MDYEFLLSQPPLVVEHQYTARDTILYALGTGAGLAASEDPRYLPFVYEEGLTVLPTMATVLAHPGFWAKDPKYGITWKKLLHRDQSVEIHGALPTEGTVRGETTIDAVYDRGAEKGALLCFSRRIFDSSSGQLLATTRQINVLRADGGFGGPPDQTPPPHEPPDRDPDQLLRFVTGRDQNLVYRLSGDYNPLHVDPDVAQAAGFPRPILHGLSSFGALGLAAVAAVCEFDATRLKKLEARFSSPVYPGDTLEIAVWRIGGDQAILQVRVMDRGVTVIRNGYVEWRL